MAVDSSKVAVQFGTLGSLGSLGSIGSIVDPSALTAVYEEGEEEVEAPDNYQEDVQASAKQYQESVQMSARYKQYQDSVQMSARYKQYQDSLQMSAKYKQYQDSMQMSAMYKQHQESMQGSARHKRTASFGNSMFQSSQYLMSQNTRSMQYNQSIQNTQSQSMQNTQSTQSNYTLQSTQSMTTATVGSTAPNTESESIRSNNRIYPTYGTIKKGNENNIYPQYGFSQYSHTKRPKKRRGLMQSIRRLRYASMSISMLAKPSTDRNANSILAGWNVSNLIQGTTILGIPYAVQQGGWAAVVMIFVLGFLTCYTGKILVECMYETSKKTGIRRRLRVDFPEIAQAALGKKGYIAMNFIQNSVMFGGCVMYIIILGTVWADVFPALSLKEWAAINCCVTLPTLFITKMSIISWFSMVSVFSIMTAFIVLIIYCFTQLPLWDIANIPAFNIETFPVGFGIIMFSYCAHAVIPSIEGSMKKPESCNSMLNASFSIATVSKATLGVLMVLRFGVNTAEVATVNLAGSMIFSHVASFLVIGNVLLAMPLEMFVVSSSYDDAMLKYFPFLNEKSGYHFVWLLISRPLLLTLSLLVAATVPHFGLLMGVVGSFSGTALCFLFPCYCHLKLRWESLTRHEVAIDVLVMVFGGIGGILGLCFSMKGLMGK